MIAAIFIAGIIIYLVGQRTTIGVQTWLGVAWLVTVWLLTFLDHRETGFVSPDEVYFATAKIESLLSNRVLWLATNKFVALTSNDVIQTMRIFNVGFLILFYVVSTFAFRSFPPLLLAFAFSYASCVAALNIRDLAILFATVILIVALGRAGHKIDALLAMAWKRKLTILILFLLRPLMLLTLLASGLRIRLLAVGALSVIGFLQTDYGTRSFYNYAYYAQNFDQGIADRAEEKELERTEPTVANIAFWTARFVFAPTPWSTVDRLVGSPETYSYGKVDLSFRTLNRFVLYLAMLALLYYVARYPSHVWRVLQDNSFVLKFAALFSLTYALFNFGQSHERIKFVILLLFFFVLDRIRVALATRTAPSSHDNLPDSYKLP